MGHLHFVKQVFEQVDQLDRDSSVGNPSGPVLRLGIILVQRQTRIDV